MADEIDRYLESMIQIHGGANILDRILKFTNNDKKKEEANKKISEFMNIDGDVIDSNKRMIKNAIITSPTQMGKTKYVIDACKLNENTGKLIIISCDNIRIQLSQLKARLTEENVINFNINNVSAPVVCGRLKNKKSVVIIMMNNHSQISKLTKLIIKMKFIKNPTRYVFFHDEADTINKTDIVVSEAYSDRSIGISHRSWANLMDMIENSLIPSNRFWISATPENCSAISKIIGKDIIVLPHDENYRGITGHTNWDLKNDLNPMSHFKYEIERIRDIGVGRAGEVILYCVDRRNKLQDEISKTLSTDYNCVTCCFNMNASMIYFNGLPIRGLINKRDTISTILEKTRDFCASRNSPFVVVGYNLMNRGMSFVAKGESPPSATVMFYSGGVTSHVVGLAQRFGRITGTSRPDLNRRHIYCSDGMYKDYLNYLKNQEMAWNSLGLEANKEIDVFKILKNMGDNANLLIRPLDRPTLCTVNKEYRRIGSFFKRSIDINDGKMKRLIDSWSDPNNSDEIAKIFRRMISNHGRLEHRLVLQALGDGPTSAMANPSHPRDYHLIFRKENGYFYIKDQVHVYLNRRL